MSGKPSSILVIMIHEHFIVTQLKAPDCALYHSLGGDGKRARCPPGVVVMALSLSKRTTLCVQSLLIYFCVRWCKWVSIHPFVSISANYGPKPQMISANGYLEQTKAVNWSAWKTVFVLFATNFFQPPLSATSSFRYCKQHYNSRFPSSCPRYM